MQIESQLHNVEVLLDLAANDIEELVHQALLQLRATEHLDVTQCDAIISSIYKQGPGVPVDLGNAVGVLRIESGLDHEPCIAIIRVPDGVKARDHARVHYLWLVIAKDPEAVFLNEELEPFGWMLQDPRFNASIIGANDAAQVLAAYQLYLEYIEAPPDVRRPSLVPSYPTVTKTGVTGFARGLKADLKRRWPHYKDDYLAGVHPKGLSTILFLFFACLAPSVAFGGLLSYLTGGEIGAMEAILATAIGGVTYAIFSGQPLTLLGSTGPVTIFIGLLYGMCTFLDVPFLPGLFWVGLWTSIIVIIFALTDASRYIKWFTRFTDEIFAALIALIFIVAAVRNIFGGLFGEEPPSSGQLLALILALGTYLIAQQLSRLRQKPLLLAPVREFLADFGPAIAILTMTFIGHAIGDTGLEHLAVPESFTPTLERAWLVNPFEAPAWFWVASIPVAILASVLMYVDQNITVRLVNSPQHRLTKGEGYNLDMLVIGVLLFVCACFGLPWVVAATVRSLNHVRSLATLQAHGTGDHIVSVRENRLTALVVHALIGMSLLFLGVLRLVPMSVLFGLFLFMGIASTRGNQFVDRLKLWVTDPKLYPPTHYIRRVPRKAIHAFTLIQFLCLVVLWVVKVSVIGVLFPLVIALLVPIRKGMGRLFDETHLAFLDADENPDEEQHREID